MSDLYNSRTEVELFWFYAIHAAINIDIHRIKCALFSVSFLVFTYTILAHLFQNFIVLAHQFVVIRRSECMELHGFPYVIHGEC